MAAPRSNGGVGQRRPPPSDAALHDALCEAVRSRDAFAVQQAGLKCVQRAGRDLLDRRAPTVEQHTNRSLAAPPHVFAAIRGDEAILEELLLGLDADVMDAKNWRWCDIGCDCCTGNGMTALQLAATTASAECVRALLRLGASAELPMCAAIDDDGAFDYSRWSAHQLARRRGQTASCELLAEHGADTVSAPSGWECPVCYDPLDEGEVEVTRCGHRFHAACLPRHLVHVCPLCRTPLADVGWSRAVPRRAKCHRF